MATLAELISNIQSRVEKGAEYQPFVGGESWTIHLSYSGREVTLPFWTASGSEPDMETVIGLYLGYAYEVENGSAEKDHVRIANKLKQFFGEDYQQFIQAQAIL